MLKDFQLVVPTAIASELYHKIGNRFPNHKLSSCISDGKTSIFISNMDGIFAEDILLFGMWIGMLLYNHNMQ